MVTIRNETHGDIAAREDLLDVFGARRVETAERLREGRSPAAGLSLLAEQDEQLVGTVRLWHARAGPGRPARCSAPRRRRGGAWPPASAAALMQRPWRSPAGAASRDYSVGDAPYYERFGFSTEKMAALWLPGPARRHRPLGCEPVPGRA